MSIVLCTLYEGDYHHGVAALANSLASSGFAGELVVGVRGRPPAWAGAGAAGDSGPVTLSATPALTLRFVPLDTTMHLTLFKPTFMLEVLNEHARDADVVAYIDPDIVVKCPWHNLAPWLISADVCAIEDVNGRLPNTAPLRTLWRQHFAAKALIEVRAIDSYVNGGFVSASRDASLFLTTWQRLCADAREIMGEDAGLHVGHGTSLFSTPDQDALNMALMVTDVTVGLADPASMDFAAGGEYLSHAIGARKPWRGRFIRNALGGTPPSKAAKFYLHYADGPVRSHSRRELSRMKASQQTASLIGRFYRRA
ncbi:hypothetical protein [Demequina mangrovi]|uniref:Glycosyl transferase family 8 n=1 Tax=Demequina mangrovi TaxID=1043493 RepID=A0A1H6YUF9_9MICO|nr:hypothetical protein [Demequina mangrovi]SEJ40920.1 hypothetical protein SAMN05421637_1754 [Demequina mangrovi]